MIGVVYVGIQLICFVHCTMFLSVEARVDKHLRFKDFLLFRPKTKEARSKHVLLFSFLWFCICSWLSCCGFLIDSESKILLSTSHLCIFWKHEACSPWLTFSYKGGREALSPTEET